MSYICLVEMNFISNKVLGGESLTLRENKLSSLTSFEKSKSTQAPTFAFSNLVYSERGLWVVPRSYGPIVISDEPA